VTYSIIVVQETQISWCSSNSLIFYSEDAWFKSFNITDLFRGVIQSRQTNETIVSQIIIAFFEVICNSSVIINPIIREHEAGVAVSFVK